MITTTKKFHAHDENNEAHKGDTVQIMETRPLSAKKRWRLLNIVEKAK
jgi:small subunit ribosomal protein S17